MNTKRCIAIITLLLATLSTTSLPVPLYAVSLTPTVVVKEATSAAKISPTGSTTNLDEKVKILKEKIESKVAEISKSNKETISGVIKKKEKDSLTITTKDGKSVPILLDQDFNDIQDVTLKNVSKIAFDDLEMGDYIVATGFLINSEMNANKLYRQKKYTVDHGQITAVNEGFSIDVITEGQQEYTLDIEKTTTQFLLNPKTLELEKSGFSKFKVGDKIHFVVSETKTSKGTYTGVRTVILPQEYFGNK